MRLNIRTFSLILFATLTIGVAKAQNNMGIGTTTPDASAILELKSTTMGFLMPRMTHAQILAIAAPATGLMAYDIDNKVFMFFDGTNWKNVEADPGITTFSANSTSALVTNNVTAQLVPGMTKNITLGKNSNVMIQVSGVASISNISNSNLSVSIFIDGVQSSSQTIGLVNTTGAATNFISSISTNVVLAAGTHTIDVKAIKSNAAAVVNVGGATGTGTQSNMVITVIPQ